MGKGAVESYKRDIRLNDRENEMKTEEKDAEEGKKAMTFDVRELIKKDKITVKLNGEGNLLFWLKCITQTTELMPPNTCELKLTTMIKNSIEDKEDTQQISSMTRIVQIHGYIKAKYMNSPSLTRETLRPIENCKWPTSRRQAISNIELTLNIMNLLIDADLGKKVEARELSMMESKCLMTNRKAKYYEGKER